MALDKQQVFDTIIRGLWAQGGPSLRPAPDGRGQQCVYRSPNGRKCVIGMLLPDAAYDPSMESSLPEGALLRKALGVEADDANWLGQVQYKLHDEIAVVGSNTSVSDEEFIRALLPAARLFAAEEGLSAAVLDELKASGNVVPAVR